MFTEVRTSDTGPTLPDSDPLHRGALAGPWRIEHELGRGGMGAVYAVVHEDIGKRAALKVVHGHALTPWFTAERFLLEARVVNQVSHPSVVDIFETGVLGDGRPYLVMERLEGMTLGQRLSAGRILADEVCAILLEVCDAIRAAHAAGIVHRDLKLDNVFLLAGPDPTRPHMKVLDWGIAKDLAMSDGSNTFADRLIGTPRYVSPEQARGAVVTTKADIYSLGIMAYELFLEEPPFTADSAAELLVMHLRDLPPPPRDAWPDIPPDLEQLLLDMLAKEPEDRPTIEDVAHTLASVRHQLAVRRVEWAPAEIESAPRVLPAPPRARTTRAITHRPRVWHALAVVALLGGSATTARILTADAAGAEVAAPAPPALDHHAIAASRPIATVGLAVTPVATTVTSPPAIEIERAPAPRKHIVSSSARRATAPPAPATPPSTVQVSHAIAPQVVPPAHRPRRVAAAIDPDGTIEPYR